MRRLPNRINISKSWMLRCGIVLALFVIANITKGQSGIRSEAIDLYEKTPGAPNSANMGRYFEYPVNMSTGLPNIQIPLYTVKSGGLSLPITLTYHPGGIMVNANASWVGIGWSLNAGGAINKRTNGLDDFSGTNAGTGNYINPNYTSFTNDFSTMSASVDSSLSNYGSLYSEALYNFWGRVTQGCMDAEADDYIYSTPQGGGKFFYNQQKQLFQGDKINGWNYTFQMSTDNANPSPLAWFITTNTGHVYKYGALEKTENPLVNKVPTQGCFLEAVQKRYVSSWYLSELNDPVNNKNIQIQYNSAFKLSRSGVTINRHYKAISIPMPLHQHDVEDSYREGDELTPSQILFDEGKVLFIQETAGRQDGGVNALKEIKILDKNDKHIKSFLFKYFYTTADTTSFRNRNPYTFISTIPIAAVRDTFSKRLYLESIQEIHYKSNGDTLKIPPYKFTYHLSTPLPCRYAFAQDSWGYYNGKNSNSTFVPDNILTMYQTYDAGTGADRFVDTLYTKAGSLSSLQYPTGGKATFDMESNRVGSQLIGGLRLRKLTQSDSLTGKTLITEYNYEEGMVTFMPQHHYDYGYISSDVGSGYGITKVTGNSIYPLFAGMGSPALYKRISQIQSGDGKQIKSRHFFQHDEGGNFDNYIGSGQGIPYQKYISYDNFNGLEYKTEKYKQTTSGFELVQVDSMEYKPLNDYNRTFWNLQTAWAMQLTGSWIVWPGNDPYTTIPMNVYPASWAYKSLQDQAIVAYQKQRSISDAGAELVQQTWLTYDTTNGNVLTKKAVSADGDTLIAITRYNDTYLHSYKRAAAPAYPMEILYMLKHPGSSDTLVTGGMVYAYDGVNIMETYHLRLAAPFSVSTFQRSYNTSGSFVMDGRYELDQEVLQRSGTTNVPLTIRKNGEKRSYVWDHSETLLIAECTNASSSDIAYTSFETTTLGNWTASGGSYVTNGSVTGKRSYSLTSGNTLTRTVATSQPYRVSYWSQGGSMLVNGGSGTAQLMRNGWTLYVHNLSATTSITLSGTGVIDELRLNPSAAKMVTMTYDPLVGITSQADMDSRVAYYEYDNYQRLHLVRDDDKNIIKRICYNYAGQPEDCSPGAVAVWQNTTTAVRCKTGSTTGEQEQEQIDINPASPTYQQTQWVVIGTSPTCVPASCGPLTCTGDDKKCINNICETGVKICERVERVGRSEWIHFYHYKWSDNSTSPTYSAPGTGDCLILED